MKIAIITPTFPPYAGGIGKVAAFNARELKKLGHQVTVFTPFYQPVKEEFGDLEIKRLKPLFKYGNAAFIPALGKMLKGFDIIHLHYPFFGGAELIWLQSRRLKKNGAKTILHYHMDVVGQGFLKTIFRFHNKFILPRLAKKADKILFTSFDYGNESNLSAELKKNSQNFMELPNGVDSRKFEPQPKNENLLKKYEINPDDKIILFVGGLDKAHYFKGIEYLLQAANILRQANYFWRLIIVGEGNLKNYYADYAGQLGLDNEVIFTGYVADDDLPKYYNLTDVCVLPSIDKSEAFGLALIEAMACAKPVVATNLAGVRSVVENEINGLLAEPKNADSLAAKINHLLVNPEIAKDFGLAGRKKVEEKYEWGRIGRKLDELYNNLNHT